MRHTRLSRLGVLAMAATAGLACAEDSRRAPLLARDLGPPPTGEAPTVPMAPIALTTHADFDAFELGQLGRIKTASIVAIYEQLAQRAEPQKSEEDARLMMRLARLAFRDPDGGTETARAWTDRLRNEAPHRPDTIYLMAELMQRLLLSASPDRTFVLSPQNRDIAERLKDDLTRLLSVAPDYLGPHGVNATMIRSDLEALEAALKVSPASAAAAEGTGARQTGPAVEARAALWQVESSGPAERASLCAALPLAAPESAVDRSLRLECALERGAATDALGLLVEGVGRGFAPEACVWVARLAARTPGLATLPGALELTAAMRAAGQAPCKELPPDG